jgi:hypothetical protein
MGPMCLSRREKAQLPGSDEQAEAHFRTQKPLRQSNPGRCFTRDFEIRFLEGPTGLAGRYGASSNSYAKPLRPTSRVRRQTERHARARTFLTEVACHCAPRGVDMPRALRASAISLRVTAQPCGPLGSLGAHWLRDDPQLASEPARLACALRPVGSSELLAAARAALVFVEISTLLLSQGSEQVQDEDVPIWSQLGPGR